MRKNFSLVELIVVIAVIAILAGLIYPAFMKARDRSRMAACASNLKQIGIALNSYTSDYKDYLPVCERLGSVYGLPALKTVLSPYLQNTNVFKCPGDLGASSVFASAGTSYEWNTFVNGLKLDKSTFTIAGETISSPFCGDAEEFHLKRRNYLYPDGRVLDKMEILINNVP